jgi:hypothetical protein
MPVGSQSSAPEIGDGEIEHLVGLTMSIVMQEGKATAAPGRCERCVSGGSGGPCERRKAICGLLLEPGRDGQGLGNELQDVTEPAGRG